jgi:arabinogalactan oligomer / maltooligosaccharide transport system permease protein
MSATLSGSKTPNGRGASSPRSLSFTSGLVVKIVLLSLLNAVAVWVLTRCIEAKAWGLVAVVAATTLALDLIYLTKRAIPGKYIFPGTVFLLVFYLFPVAYTVQTSFTNYGGSNLLSKQQAIARILATSREPVSGAYTMSVLEAPDKSFVYVLTDADGKSFIGKPGGLEPADPAKLQLDADSNIVSYDGAAKMKLRQLADNQDAISAFRIKTSEGEIRAESLNSASAEITKLRYDAKRDVIIDNLDGTEYLAKRGVFVNGSGAEQKVLEPGFKASIGLRHYADVIGDPNIRGPFLRVFLWNIAFAGGTVFLTMFVGMLLAMALHHPKFRGTKAVRLLLFIPYALPSAMMILVWSQGLMNPKYGWINQFFGTNIAWLDTPWLARGSILLINTWLGFPYMFLLCTGLLMAIPAEFKEAASIDGATGWQSFRHVTLPNLLLGLSPMLISTFAFNFNNLGPIFLSTKGGPPIPGSRTEAGQTDILISWTQKLAFGSGKGSQYGLASTISVLIFFIVGLISAVSFSNTKAFKETK